MGQQRDISRRGSCGCRSEHVKDIYVYCRYVERTNLFAKAVNGVLRDVFLKKHDIQSRACSARDIFRRGSCGCRSEYVKGSHVHHQFGESTQRCASHENSQQSSARHVSEEAGFQAFCRVDEARECACKLNGRRRSQQWIFARFAAVLGTWLTYDEDGGSHSTTRIAWRGAEGTALF